jgi:hypothetical protein
MIMFNVAVAIVASYTLLLFLFSWRVKITEYSIWILTQGQQEGSFVLWVGSYHFYCFTSWSNKRNPDYESHTPIAWHSHTRLLYIYYAYEHDYHMHSIIIIILPRSLNFTSVPMQAVNYSVMITILSDPCLFFYEFVRIMHVLWS